MIWIKQNYHSNQPCNKLQNLFPLDAAATCATILLIFIAFKSFIITRIIDSFVRYMLSKQTL